MNRQESAVAAGPVGLLADRARSGASGILSFSQGKLKRLFCLREGHLVHAASNMVEEQFDEHLVQRKILSVGERAVAKLEASKAELKFTGYVRAQHLVAPKPLMEELRAWATGLLHAALEDETAEYDFRLGQPKLDGEVLVHLSCLNLVVAHALRYPKSLDEVRILIGPPDLRPVISKRFETFLRAQETLGATKYLLETVDGELDLEALTTQAPFSSTETLRTIYGLLRFGALEEAKAKPKVSGVAAEQATRSETLARLDRAINADHYAILGVSSNASEQEVRAGYYVLARRFHPDRFRSGPLSDLIEQVESFFTQVTEAYNTLADAELRERYDEELAAAAGAGPDEKEQEKETTALARQNYVAAKALLAKNRFQDAVKFLENAVQIDGTQAIYFLELGRVKGQNPRFREAAEQHLLRAAELDPALSETYFVLGALYRKQSRVEEAVKMFREVLSWDPGNLDAEAELKEMGADPGRRR